MRYVYLLQSEAFAGHRYVGVTSDLKQRIADHNAGKVSAYVQIRSLEVNNLRRILGRTKSRDFRALPEIRLRPRLRQEKAMVGLERRSSQTGHCTVGSARVVRDADMTLGFSGVDQASQAQG